MNLLIVTPTDREMAPVLSRLQGRQGCSFAVCGVGPVEAGVNTAGRLGHRRPDLLILTGVAGGYLDNGLELLDICLAEKEVLGDLGVCQGEEIHPLTGEFPVRAEFAVDSRLLAMAEDVLASRSLSFHRGTFVTVSCTSGTEARGRMLAELHHGLCENMEGAAVCKACQLFGTSFLEIRAVSNLVCDRNRESWKIDEAAAAAAQAVQWLADELLCAREASDE